MSYMTNGLLIYEWLNICSFPHTAYLEALPHTVYDFATAPFLIYEENFLFFLSVRHQYYGHKLPQIPGLTFHACDL
jgi:hypothetical protein